MNKNIGVNVLAVFDAAKGLWGAVSSLFGKDSSPNYPIKSANTEKTLKAEVANNIPFPPTSVAHAQQLINKAIELKNAVDTTSNGSQRVKDTLKIMYDEAISVLQAWVAAQGGTVSVPAGSGFSGVQNAVAQNGTKANASNMSTFFLVALALGGAYFLFGNKKRR
jgi:hypothetical protein